MINKIVSKILVMVSVCFWLGFIAPGEQLQAGEIIKVQTYIVKGSAWESPAGRALIEAEVVEARLIWFAGIGVKLSIRTSNNVIAGNPAVISKEDIQAYADTLNAAKDNIVVILTDKSWGVSRAYAEKSLVDSDKPVIIMGKDVLDKPGTKRDLAHEIGHILTRDPGHSNGSNDLMNITSSPNNGNEVTPDQKEKALKYPNK